MKDNKEMTKNFPLLFCLMSIKYVCSAFLFLWDNL